MKGFLHLIQLKDGIPQLICALARASKY